MRRVLGLLTAVILMAGPGFGQSAKPESHKGRTILSIAGAGGGFTAGVFLGIAAFDDSINSDRKVWTSALLGAGAGGLGGFFLGRAIDRRHRTSGVTVSPFLGERSKGVQLALQW